jgi:hypothetical protein
MAAFKPVGTRAMWREIYDNASVLSPGAIITYEDLEVLIGYDLSKPGASRSPIYRASQELLSRRSKMLIPVPGEGYRVAHATEHETAAKGHQRGARRKLTKAVSVAVNVDRNQLTDAQRKSLDGLADLLMAQNAMLSRHDRRIGDVEKDVAKVDDRVGVLEQALRTHGIDVPERRVVEGETA